MPFWIGVVTLMAGVSLWLWAVLERAQVPPWLPRLALAVVALGLATLAATRPGTWWSVSAICFSLVAIVLLLWVMVDTLPRR